MLQKNRLLLLSTAVIATAAIAAPVAAEAASYTVSKGDNLTKIATANKVTVSQLKQWNNLKNDFLYVGQKLTVSAVKQTTTNKQQVTSSKQQATVKTPAPTKAPAVTTTNSTTYTVAKGDNLSKIAKAVNATVADIKKWNGLKSDSIYVGQKLKISEGKITSSTQQSAANKVVQSTNTVPASNAALQTYQVMKGDSLSKIASKFKVSVADIKNWNQFNSDLIYIGQVIKVMGSSEQGEPEVQLDPKEELKSDQLIDEKLSNELPIRSNLTATGQALYSKVLEMADALKGTPYLFAGNDPTGFDCSGFVKYVYSTAGIDIVRKSSNDYFMNDTVIVENPVPGDLIFFKNTYIEGISHMGIYIGDDQFIHAGSNGVEISKLSYDYWSSKFVAFKRFKQVK